MADDWSQDEPNGPRAHVPLTDEHDDVSPGHDAQDDGGAAVEVPRSLPSGLIPFRAGDPWASEAGRRSAAARRARRAITRAETQDVATALASLVESYGRENLGDVAAAAALDMIGRVSRGEIQPRDPADWVRVLVDIARLERGQATSAALVAHISSNDAGSRLAALQSTAREALARVNGQDMSAAASAVADVGTDEQVYPPA